MKKRDDDSKKGRQPYEKPHLRTFPLAADEVLAKGCKMTSGFAGFQGPNCSAGGCFAVGS